MVSVDCAPLAVVEGTRVVVADGAFVVEIVVGVVIDVVVVVVGVAVVIDVVFCS